MHLARLGIATRRNFQEYSDLVVSGVTPEELWMSMPNPIGLERVVAPPMAGTVVEWYEFFLDGTADTLACPIGGIVLGHFGDKYGRKKLLQFRLLLAGAATGNELADIDRADAEELAIASATKSAVA